MPKFAVLLVFVVCFGGALAMMVFLRRHGAPLKTLGDHRILDLELAPTDAKARTIIASWRKANLLDLACEDIRFDYGFIALYTAALALGSFYGIIVWAGVADWMSATGRFLGWAVFVAGLMDVLENLGMRAELGGTLAVAPIVSFVSSIKWVIALAAAVYLLPTLFMMAARFRLIV